MLNLGLKKSDAPSVVNSGLRKYEVVPLVRGTELYRFGTATGPWWVLAPGYFAIQRLAFMAHQELSLHERISHRPGAQAITTRKHLAVLHEWSKLDKLTKGEVAQDILVFLGSGRPMREVMPNGMTIVWDCPEVPQVFVPNLDKHPNAIRVHSTTKMHHGKNLW